jgi:hypothetical protein
VKMKLKTKLRWEEYLVFQSIIAFPFGMFFSATKLTSNKLDLYLFSQFQSCLSYWSESSGTSICSCCNWKSCGRYKSSGKISIQSKKEKYSYSLMLLSLILFWYLKNFKEKFFSWILLRIIFPEIERNLI